MKVFMSCHECRIAKDPDLTFMYVDLRDDGLYEVECARGHRSRSVLASPRHELLMDSAALALRDNYNREAVVSFSAALEAFWGFYVRVVALNLGAPHQELAPLRANLKLSERRLGAMQLAHLLLTKAAYKEPTARRNFRNEVVHDGLFPTRDQAFDYAAYVFDVISDCLDQLHRLADESMQRVCSLDMIRGHEALRSGGAEGVISTFGVVTLLTHERRCLTRRPFADAFRQWSELNVWDANEYFASTGTRPRQVGDDD